MSALLATVLLSSLVMLTTMGIILGVTRLSSNREQRWLSWANQWPTVDYQARKLIELKKQQTSFVLLCHQHRFVAHWLENRPALILSRHQSTSTNSSDGFWQTGSWSYFEFSLPTNDTMLTQSVITIPCHLNYPGSWRINAKSSSSNDAFYQAESPILLPVVDDPAVDYHLEALAIEAERPHTIQHILHPPVYQWLQQHPEISVEWLNDHLSIYRRGILLSPEKLPEALEQAIQLCDLLQPFHKLKADPRN